MSKKSTNLIAILCRTAGQTWNIVESISFWLC